MKKTVWKRTVLVFAFVLLVAMLAAGCGAPAGPAPKPEPDPTPEQEAPVEKEEDGEASTYRDGTFEAVSQGNERGYVLVTLTVENDEVTGVTIVEFDGVGVEKIYEDYGKRFPMLEEAHNELTARMVAENTWDVDVVSGATSTSEKTREAARFALERAKAEPADSEHFDGTFMAISDITERGWGIAWVTLENGDMTGIRLEETTAAKEDGEDVFDEVGRQVFVLKSEEYPWAPYHEAREAISGDMLESQSPQVDTYTEATGSSERWIQAVERAKDWAGTR